MQEINDQTITAIWPKINQALPEEFKNNNLKLPDDILAYIDHLLIETDKLISIKKLYFSGLKLKIIPEFLFKFPNLKYLDLNNNHISSLPTSILKSPKKIEVLLIENSITVIPSSFFCNNEVASFNEFPKIYLYKNPLLIVHNKDKDIDYLNNFISFSSSEKSPHAEKYAQFKNYTCTSQLSLLCQLIALEHKVDDDIKSVFAKLKDEDQKLIFKALPNLTFIGPDLNDTQLEWAKEHIFDNMHTFSFCVHEAINQKFEKLSKEEKNKVYERISLKVKGNTDLEWGELHAFDNILLLLDVIDEVEENSSSINCVIS
jgi:hypothetical protein